MNNALLLLSGFLFLTLTGCASQQTMSTQVTQIHDSQDPLESINRAMWRINYDLLDEYILRPTAVAYADYIPATARSGLLNVALNLEEPAYSVNNLLQGKVQGSLVSLSRFLINSTVGLLGSMDVARHIGLEREEEHFGEVLGQWGIGSGPYLMLPAMGPSDLRSSVGDYVDYAYGPLDALSFYFTALRISIKALDARVALIQQEQQLNASADPYNFVKNAYFQNLEFKVNDGKLEKSTEEQALENEIDRYLNEH